MGPYLNDNSHFLLINKNIPFCMIAYGRAIFLFRSRQQWFFIWLIIELSTLGFIRLYFYEKVNSDNITLYFLIQRVASFFILMALILTPAEPFTKFYLNILLIGGIIIKLGVFPFHNWVAAVTMSIKKFLFFLILLIQKIIPFLWLLISRIRNIMLLIIIATINIIWVSPQNLFQTSIKIIIVLSRISHSRWVLLSLRRKFLWEIYFITYVVILRCVLFYYNENLKNIFQKNERTPLFLIFLTLGGVPPFIGFYPKFLLIFEVLQTKLILFLRFFLLTSLIDLLVYRRLGMTRVIKNKMSLKWQKINDTLKWFILINIVALRTLLF